MSTKFPAKSLVWVSYGGEDWPARVHDKSDFDTSSCPEPELADPKTGALCVQFYDDPNDPTGGSVSLVDPTTCTPLDWHDKTTNDRKAAAAQNQIRAGISLAIKDGERVDKLRRAEEDAARAKTVAEDRQKREETEKRMRELGGPDRRLMNQLMGLADFDEEALSNAGDGAGSVRQRDGEGAGAGGLAPPPPRPPPVQQAGHLKERSKSGSKAKATTAAAAAAAASGSSHGASGRRRGTGTSEWSAEDANAVFSEVAPTVGDFYRNPKIIGAFTFDGCVSRNDAARAAAGVAGHKMHLTIPRFGPEYIQPKFLIVPTHDDHVVYPWMESLAFENRQVQMKIKIDDMEFPVPANWRIPASKTEQWAPARSPIPVDITAAIMRKSPPPQKVQVSIFIDGLMKTDAAAASAAATVVANVAAGKKTTAAKGAKDNLPPAPTKAEDDAMSDIEWSGILVALVAECSRPDREIVSSLQKRQAEPMHGANDDAAATSKVSVSRKCSITLQDLKVPIRSRYCVHAQCADAAAVVQLARKSHLWRCPHCLCAAQPSDWGVDSEFQQALQAHPNTPEFLATGPVNGKFKYEPKK